MRIQGTIKDARTEIPLSGVLITLKLEDTVLVDNSQSSDGQFQFDFSSSSFDWSRRMLTGTFRKSGYHSQTVSYKIDEGSPVVINAELTPIPVKWPRVLKTVGLIFAALILLAAIAAAIYYFFFAPGPPPPEILSFKSNFSEIAPNQPIKLSWSSQYATAAFLGTEQVELNGALDATPKETTTYTLRLQNKKGDVTEKSLIVTIPPSPQIVLFKTDPPNININDPTTLEWETVNTEKIYIMHDLEGGDTPLGPAISDNTGQNAPPGEQLLSASPDQLKGKVPVYPPATLTFTLVAVNRVGETARAQTTVTVNSPPEITTFGATRTLINPGETTLLNWKTKNGVEVTINDNPTRPIFSMEVAPTVTTIYTLIAKNTLGLRQKSIEITIPKPDPGKPPDPQKEPAKLPNILSFIIEPLSIAQGQSAQISWTTENASEIYLDDERVNPSGSKTVSPSSPRVYTLKALNIDGKADTWPRKIDVRPVPCTIILYQLENYRGDSLECTTDTPDIGPLHHRVSSIRIIGDCSAKVYSGRNYSATSMIISESAPKLRGSWIGNHAIASLRFINTPNSPAPQPDAPTAEPTTPEDPPKSSLEEQSNKRP